MATDFDPYRILGIDRTAFSDDIYNAYQRALAESDSDEPRRREIDAAYAILGNMEQRREYDARVRERELTGAPGGSGNPRDELRSRTEALIKDGFELRMAAEDAAYLTKRGKYAWGWAVFWLLFGILPLAIYLLVRKQDQTAYLWIDSVGNVHKSLSDIAAPDSILEALGLPKPNRQRVAWTLGDIAKALFLPMLLVGANIIAGFVDDVDTDDFTEGDFITAYVFTIILEIALLGLAWHFGLRKHKLSWRAFGFHWPKTMRWWFPFAVTSAALVSIWTYIGFLALVGADTEGNVPENAFDYVIPVILLGLLSVIVAPIIEEIYFRAFVYQGLARQWGVAVGVVVSALIFGLFHIGGPDTLLVAPVIILIGGIFAWAFSRHGSIYPGIIAHFIFNSISYVAGVLSN
ncbi:MAG TPA: CPBP family glutamic-type intramembrane protease [Dehalococcoidia bacterium]|nr:CPBP family glutamic-type intramembrane protease [Dehalococcoidia bacterium]